MAHNSQAFDWDDLRFLLAVARHGSTLAAGRALGVDQSTVQRRLAELERRIGQSLVQRQPTGYRLTELGQEMLPFAESIERSVQAFERQLHTLGTEAAGVIRVTCPEPIVNRITQTGLLDRFHARHPALRVQFVMSDKYIDLTQGEADVALRSGDTDDDELVGRKIGDSIWAIYASRNYVEHHGQPAGIEELERWLRLSEHRSSFDKWSAAGLTLVQSCPWRRSVGACDVPADRRGGQLVFTAQAACLIAGSDAK